MGWDVSDDSLLVGTSVSYRRNGFATMPPIRIVRQTQKKMEEKEA